MNFDLRQLAFLAGYGSVGVVLTLVVGFGIQLANRPAPMPWHLAQLGTEVFARVPADERRAILALSPGDFARLRHNPFFPYVESSVNAFLAARER